MKILFLTHFFPPEIGPGQTRVYEYAKGLVKKGHDVTVLTPFPNYPTGIIPKKYKGHIFFEESMDGIQVKRTLVYATPNKGFFRRVINHVSFALSSIIAAFRIEKKFDVVNVISPPLFLGLSGYLIAAMKKAKMAFEVRDLWPESGIALGIIKNKVLIQLTESLEKFIYIKSDLITTATVGIRKEILKKRIPSEKVCFLPSGIDINLFQPSEKMTPFREQLGSRDDFIALYTGAHGLSHNIENILFAAERLQHQEYKNIKFVLIGDGSEKEKLMAFAQKKELHNVEFHEPQKRERMPEIIASADVCIATLKKLEIFKGALPTKVFEYMACSRPLIACIDGEVRKIIEQFNTGLFVEPENSDDLASALVTLYKNNALRDEMGRNGRTFIVNHYSRQTFINRMESNFKDLVAFGKIRPENIDIRVVP